MVKSKNSFTFALSNYLKTLKFKTMKSNIFAILFFAIVITFALAFTSCSPKSSGTMSYNYHKMSKSKKMKMAKCTAMKYHNSDKKRGLSNM